MPQCMLFQSLTVPAPVSDVESSLMLILSNEAQRLSKASTCLEATSTVDDAAVILRHHTRLQKAGLKTSRCSMRSNLYQVAMVWTSECGHDSRPWSGPSGGLLGCTMIRLRESASGQCNELPSSDNGDR